MTYAKNESKFCITNLALYDLLLSQPPVVTSLDSTHCAASFTIEIQQVSL